MATPIGTDGFAGSGGGGNGGSAANGLGGKGGDTGTATVVGDNSYAGLYYSVGGAGGNGGDGITRPAPPAWRFSRQPPTASWRRNPGASTPR